MPFEPVSPLGGFTGLAEPREPERFTDVNPETRPFQETPSVMDAAFRTENTVGSSVASEEVRYRREAQGVFGAPVKIDPDYDPWADIVDTRYETYADKFAAAGNRDHANAIKADIDRETKDRDTIAKSGWTGIGASMAAGVLDLPIFLPGGNLVRTAKGGVSLLRTAGSTAAYGTAAAIASETVLHGSQQLRTGEESAMVIGGSTVLAGLLGAGFGKLFSRAEQAAFAARVEKDFTIPGHGEPDHYTPGGVQVDAAPGASTKAASVADIIRQTAEEILPPQVRVQVADKIDIATGGKFAARPVSDQDRLLASAAWQPDRETFGQMLGDDLPRGRQHYEGEALNAYDRMAENIAATKQAADAGDSAGAKSALSSALHDAAELERLAPGSRTKLYTQFVKQAGRRHGVEAISPEAKAAQDKADGSKFSIKAYHGTPHDFDEFDLSKIGTGEGNQAFGHGLYFAENEGVGTAYRDVLSLGTVTVNGRAVAGDDVFTDLALAKLQGRDSVGLSLDEVRAGAEEGLRQVRSMPEPTEADAASLFTKLETMKARHAENIAHAESYLAKIKEVQAGDVKTSGNLYEVELDVEPHRLLDWDKTLSEQSPAVRALAEASDSQIVKAWKKAGTLDRHTGADLYRLLAKEPEEAAAILRDGGVPGIRYADQISRDVGIVEESRTRNIVIFDDKLVKITKKNGESVTAAERKAAVDQMFSVRRSESQTETPEFKRWFGESKVVDESGVPLVVYHGTNQDLEAFSKKRIGKNTTAASSIALFFSENASEASEYANLAGRNQVANAVSTEKKIRQLQKKIDAAESRGDWNTAERLYLELENTDLGSIRAEPEGQNILPVYLNIKNPKVLDMKDSFDGHEVAAAIKLAKKEGHDGLKLENVFDPIEAREGSFTTTQWVAFEPTQIKSVFNRGSFDPNDPRIAFGVRKEGAETVAEGRYDPQQNLITISADALDPVKTLKHESIHALRTMNLFSDKEWGTLEAAARKQGWVESNNVKSLYEELYSGKAGGEAFSLRGGQTETPEFKRWFGESKVVSDDGKPLVVYHGTRSDFDTFDVGRQGQSDFGAGGRGFYFSQDPGTANVYASLSPSGDAPNIMPVYLTVKNPYEMGAMLPRNEAESLLLTKRVREAGHDGIIVRNNDGVLDEIIVFDPTQIKSATGNRGTFNPSDPRIQYSVRGEGKASAGPLDPKLENLLIEEAIAEQFSLWRQGAIQVTGTVAKLFQRIKDFLDRIGNALRGQGFQTADDVFASVRGGDVAGRAAQQAPAVAPGLPGGVAMRSVGAAAREAVDNTLKPALGLETVRVDPLIYLQNSKSEKSRTYIQELAETPLAYKKNAQGMETAPLGSEMGEPGAVESRIKMWQAPLAESVKYLDNAFMQYRKGRDAQMFDRMRTTIGDALSKPEKLDWRQFKEEVAKAARRGDAHEIPEVAQAAKFARESVFNPLKDRAIAKELLPEDISVETAESYLNRMYNKEKIIARRPEFKGIVENWLDEVEFRNGVTRAQLSPLLKRLDKLQEAAKPKPAAKAGAKAKPVDPAKAEAAAEKAAADKAEMTELQEQIEALVLRYEGKTKAEAESAVKAREKAEVGRDPAAKRLRAADKPIIRAARNIAAQVDKEAGETASLADEIIDRVLGTPEGRLPYDAHLNRTTDSNGVTSQARGPLAARTFMIPDALIEDFLENDFEMLMNAYVRTMAPDVEIHARFGDMNMERQRKEIQDDWARINSRATSEKERRSLHAQRDGDLRRLAAIRDRLRGTYKLPDNPDGMLLRAGRVMRSVNYMAMLGGQVASAIPDMGSIVFSHGIMRTFGDGIIPLFRNFSGARMAMGEVKLAGTALDMVLDSRAMNIGEIMDDYGRHSKFERGVQSLTRNFGPVSLMSPWNAALKQTAGLITMSRIIKASDALRRDVITKPDLERLAASGISPANAKKIAEQFKKHGDKDGGVYLPKTENWDADARAAKEAFRVALVREVDKTIITPGQEKWLWMSTELGKTLGQFKSFSVSANQRLLIAGLQQRDMGTLSGAALMVALGGLVHVLKTKAGGRDPGIDWSDNEKTSQFMVNAVDRSGLLGWLMEANAVSEKVTGGQVGLSKLTGRPISRYASRNLVGAMAGPTFGTLQSIGQVSSAGFSEWKETDTRAARRLIPYQNLFYMRSLFDKAEEGVNSYFGVPKTATRR